jgi:hypothetical protein
VQVSVRNCLPIDAVLEEYRRLVDCPAERDDLGFQVEELRVHFGRYRSIAGKMSARQYQEMTLYDRRVVGK